MNRVLIVISTILILGMTISCKTKKVQSSSTEETAEVKEPKVYKDGYELIFKGSGHEPEWSVEVTEGQIIYKNINLPEPMIITLERTTHIMDVAGIGYLGKTKNGEAVTVQVLKEKCEDTMANKEFPFSVDVTVGNMNNLGQRGCGEFIEDERLKKEWFLETFKGQAIKKVDMGSRPVLKFNTKKNQLNANMGCNGIGGGYLVMEDRIFFNPGFMSTQMFCEGKMELEKDFTKMIAGKTFVYSFKGQTLIFKNLNGVEMMTLRNK